MSAEPVKLGSEAHKLLFCRMLLDTHNPYKPAVLDWPSLEDAARARLTGLPIWNIAVQTEGYASLRVMSYAAILTDPLLKEAVELDGFEEARHKRVLSNLVQAYGIALEPEPEYRLPADPEFGWMRLGYGECIDSVFAFGLFESAKRSGFFPAELVQTFEPVIQEEARHILFFVNWVAWRRRSMPLWRRPRFFLKIAAVWAVLIWERFILATRFSSVEKGDNFTTSAGSIGVDLNVGDLLAVCLAENDRRLAGYDARLLRPKLVPFFMRLALRFLRKKRA